MLSLHSLTSLISTLPSTSSYLCFILSVVSFCSSGESSSQLLRYLSLSSENPSGFCRCSLCEGLIKSKNSSGSFSTFSAVLTLPNSSSYALTIILTLLGLRHLYLQLPLRLEIQFHTISRFRP